MKEPSDEHKPIHDDDDDEVDDKGRMPDAGTRCERCGKMISYDYIERNRHTA
jgi:hypothetical protein